MSDTRLQVIVDAQTLGFQRGMEQVSRRLGVLRRDQAKTVVSSKALERSIRSLTRELDRQSVALGVLTLRWTQLRSAMLTLGIRTVVTGFAAMTSSAAALAAAVVQVTAGLSAFSAAAATVGASSLSAIVQGATVASLALDGVGKALTTTGQEHEKALEKLTKPARAFVKEIGAMRDAYREVKLVAQASLFDGLTRAVRKAAPLLEPFKQVVSDTAEVLGYLAERAAEVAASRALDLEALGQRNVVTLRRMGDAAINWGETFTDVFRAADPLIGHITRRLVTFSEKVRDAAKDARANGGLASFFYDLRVSFDQWTSVAGNMGRVLAGVWKAQVDPARELTASIDRVTERWGEFTNSDQGQRKMTAFFRSSNQVLGSMARFMGALAESLGRISMKGARKAIRFFEILRTQILPILERLALSFNATLFPAILDVTEAVAQFVRSVQPGLEEMSGVMSTVLSAVGDAIKGVESLIDGLPPINRLLTGLVIGGLIIGSWGKLSMAIKLATLHLRQFLGLAPEIAGMGAASKALLFQRGGRNQGAEGGNVGGGGAAVAYAGGGLGRRGGGGGRRVTLSEALGNSSHVLNRGGGPMFLRPAGGGLTPELRARLAHEAHATGSRMGPATAQPFAGPVPIGRNGRPLAGGALMAWQRKHMLKAPTAGLVPTADITGPQRVAGRFHRVTTPQRVLRFGAQREMVPVGAYSSLSRPKRSNPIEDGSLLGTMMGSDGKLTKGAGPMGRGTRLADNLATATKVGIEKGGKLAMGGLKASFAFAAVNGVISGLASDEKRVGDRLRDALAGATFGLTQTAQEKRAATEQQIASAVKDPRRVNVAQLTGIEAFGGATADLTNAAARADFTKLINQTERAGKISAEAAEQFRGLTRAVTGGVSKMGPEAARLRGALAAGLDLGGKSAQVVTDLGRVRGALEDTSKLGGLSLTKLKERVEGNMEAISATLGKDSESGRLALAQNFRLAADAVRKSMEAGKISTKTGTALIRKYLIDALIEINPAWNRKQAGNYLREDKVSTTGQNDRKPNARGGLHTVAGFGGPDKVPLDVGGQRFVVAPGEDVAVVNRHQRAVLDQRLADMGGFPGLFRNVSTPHNKPGFARGGMVTGDTDFRPELRNRLERMAQSTNTPIFVQSGGRTIAEQQALYDRYKGKRPVAVPNPNAPHVRGVAADITPGREKFGQAAGRFGLSFTVPSESWHIELSDGAGGTFSVAAADLPKIAGAKSGMGGTIGALVDGGLDKLRQAAQARLSSAASAVGFTGADGAAPSGGGASSAGGAFDKAMLASLWTQAGGNPQMANLMAAIALAESSGNATNVGPQTTNGRARGLWQIMWPLHAGLFPGMDPFDPADNAKMAVRIYQMQGLGAWEAYTRGMHAKFLAGGSPSLLGRMAAAVPGRRDGTPTVNVGDAVPRKSPSKSKKKKGKRQDNAPGYPDISKVKKRAAGNFSPKVGKRARNLMRPFKESPLALVTNWDRVLGQDGIYAKKALNLTDAVNALEAYTHALTEEQFLNEDGSLNMDGYKDPKTGKFVHGITHRIGELNQSIGFFDQIMGVDRARLAIAEAFPSRANPLIKAHEDRLKAIDAMIEHDTVERREDAADLKKEQSKAGTWQDRVATNDAKLSRLRAYKRRLTGLVGDEPAAARRRADRDIAELNEENKRLRRVKPKAGRGSAERASRLARSIATRDHRLEYLGRGRERIQGDYDALVERRTLNEDLVRTLRVTQLPLDNFEIQRRTLEITDLGGMKPDLRNADEGPLAGILRQQLDQANDDKRRAEALFGVFSGFAPLVGQRLVGAFAHGGVIPQTGMALVHKNETIIPDPNGPYRNQAGEQARSGGGDSTIVVHLGGDLAPLVSRVSAKVVPRAVQASSQQLGRRTRAFVAAPGGG